MLSGGTAGAQVDTPIDVRKDIQYGVANGKPLLLDAYVPPSDGDERRPAVLLIHGGGFRVGDKASFEPEARTMAIRGWVVFSVNYRLDEPSAFPAELDDVRAAVGWVRTNAAEYEIDPDRIGALGESAGGTLASLLATTGAGLRVAASWSGPMDLAALSDGRDESWGRGVMGCPVSQCRDRFVEASPVTHVDASDSPLFVANSTDELVPLSQARAMTDRLKAAKVENEAMILEGKRHALDYREEAIGRTVQFLEDRLEGTGPTRAGTVAFTVTMLVVVVAAAVLLFVVRRRRIHA